MNHIFRTLTLAIAVFAAEASSAQDSSMLTRQRSTPTHLLIARSLNYGLSPQITNISGRETQSLDGEWKAIIDQYENGYYNYRLDPMADGSSFFADRSFKEDKTRLIEYDFDTDGSLTVPADWNTQRPELYYYEGTIWYRQKFNVTLESGYRYFLYFGAVNYEAVIGVNGRTVSKHTGGYTPFNTEVTGLLKNGENTVIVKADNKRHAEGVPTVNSDWWNYGGITRSVKLVKVPDTFIREYSVVLQPEPQGRQRIISGWVMMDGPDAAGQTVTVSIPELKATTTVNANADGLAKFTLKARPELWTPDNPVMYDIRITSQDDDLTERMGLRTVTVQGSRILLNGKPVFCRGVSLHEEKPFSPSGRSNSLEDFRTLLTWAKEMNCNFLRLAHYPHSEEMVRMAEEMGIMIWSEVPVYWTIHWDNPDTYTNAEAQLRDMITRDRNRANVIIWSVANETPRSDARLRFLSRLIDKAREMDPTRLISAAMEKEYINDSTCTVNDELANIADLLSFNQYIGWYDGSSDKCDRISWKFSIEKPVFISEYGGGALYGLHGPVTERFTEEYQENLYRKNIAMLSRIPGLAGSTPWILKDFRSPRRQLKGIQDDFNRKGLISDKGEKKKAFYIMQEWYGNLADAWK